MKDKKAELERLEADQHKMRKKVNPKVLHMIDRQVILITYAPQTRDILPENGLLILTYCDCPPPLFFSSVWRKERKNSPPNIPPLSKIKERLKKPLPD